MSTSNSEPVNSISQKELDELSKITTKNSGILTYSNEEREHKAFYDRDTTQKEAMKNLLENIKNKQGVKNNKYKLPMSKLFVQFPRALQAVVLSSCYGHNEYKETDKLWNNFKNLEGGSENYKDAEIRHNIDKYIEGENDNESGLPHIFHQLWNKMAECELWIEENNIDMKDYAKKYLKNLAEKE